jgi:hypothetical protein
MTRRPGPRRESEDEHVHPDLWQRDEHYRYEDRMHKEFENLEKAVDSLKTRLTLMIGGLTLVAILLPVIAPFVRAWLDIPSGL